MKKLKKFLRKIVGVIFDTSFIFGIISLISKITLKVYASIAYTNLEEVEPLLNKCINKTNDIFIICFTICIYILLSMIYVDDKRRR